MKNAQIFTALSEVNLDVEGSNLTNTGWFPSESERPYMSEKQFNQAKEEAVLKDSKVLFKNVFVDWDSCDCSDGMCSHGSYVYQIRINSGDKTHELELDDDAISVYNDGKRSCIPLDATAYDFYRMCELVGIQLTFSDYANELINNTK